GLGCRPREASGSEILHGDEVRVADELEAGLDQELLEERVADLDGGALLLGLFIQLGRGEARTGNAVAPGGRTHQEDRVTGARGLCSYQAVAGRDAEAEHVH